MLAVISVQTSRRLTAACCKAMAVPLTRSFQKKAQGKAIIGETKGEKARAGEKKLGEAINQFISAAEAAKLQQPELSDEKKAEHEAIAKEFTRQNMRRTNRLNKDLSDKIWLSQDALRAMPAHLRTHAELIDDTPPPPDRPWPMYDTPPIPGFNPREMSGVKKDGQEEEEDKD